MRDTSSNRWKKAHPDEAALIVTHANAKKRGHAPPGPHSRVALREAQHSLCAICGQIMSPPVRGQGRGQCVRQDAECLDHDHKTGRVRGLLCRACNLGIGNLLDDPERCRKAADYLLDGPGSSL